MSPLKVQLVCPNFKLLLRCLWGSIFAEVFIKLFSDWLTNLEALPLFIYWWKRINQLTVNIGLSEKCRLFRVTLVFSFLSFYLFIFFWNYSVQVPQMHATALWSETGVFNFVFFRSEFYEYMFLRDIVLFGLLVDVTFFWVSLFVGNASIDGDQKLQPQRSYQVIVGQNIKTFIKTSAVASGVGQLRITN